MPQTSVYITSSGCKLLGFEITGLFIFWTLLPPTSLSFGFINLVGASWKTAYTSVILSLISNVVYISKRFIPPR